jgi:hypothetical protein
MGEACITDGEDYGLILRLGTLKERVYLGDLDLDKSIAL